MSEVNPLYKSDVYDDIGRETFEKIAIEEEIALKLTDQAIECKNAKCRCKVRQKENEGIKT